MALTKVTKHIVHGSLLVQYKFADIADGNSSSTGDTNIGSPLAITPQYADSILETTFSCSIENTSNGDNYHFRLALYVNGIKEYEQTELLGGPRGGAQFNHHGGNFERVHAHVTYQHLRNARTSAGFTHAMTPGNTNAQSCQITAASYNDGGRTFTVREGFLIIKELSMGITSLSGGQ